jgi:hypothetical protein
MPPRLKDCGLDGCCGSVQYCPECRRATVHFRWPDGVPVCGWCGQISTNEGAALAQPRAAAQPLYRLSRTPVRVPLASSTSGG